MGFAFIFDSVGGTEWFVLLGVVLIVVGPKNLPAAARKLGQVMTNLRRAADEFKRQLMTMDQEVRSAVNDAVADTSSSDGSSSSSSSSETDASAEDVPSDEGGNPYPEGSPYPGHEDFYDETSYDGGYGEDGPYGEEDGASDGADEPPSPAEPAQPPPPTDEELKRVTIKVSPAPGKRA